MQGCKPSELDGGATLAWTVPVEISARGDIDRIRIFKSGSEDTGYEKIDEIVNNPLSFTTSYHDSTGMRGGHFYLVTFLSTSSNYESCYHITFLTPTPREARLIEQIRRATPDIIRHTLTNEDYMSGLNLAVQIFNAYPPQTGFTLAGFPRSYEFFLIGLGQLTALTSRFLPISIRDWRYSEPGGIVMDVDRGAKINQALEIIAQTYTQYLPLVKLDFASDFPLGVGTIQLPLSMGGIVSRGVLNILDIFTATGR